jgi:hypothetical protein
MHIRSILQVSLICVFLLVTATAFAGPSFRGYSGLVYIPTADSLDMGEYNLGWFTVDVDEGIDHTLAAANIGLLAGFEVGVAREKPESGDAEVLLNGKLRFQSESFTHPEVAIGISDLTDEIDATPYLVVSKSFRPPAQILHREVFNPRLHVGIGGGRLDGLFLGASVGIGHTATLMAEHDGEHFNAGLRFSVGNMIQIHGAALNDFDDYGFGISLNRRL